jgi:hypothetical protein
MQPASVPAPQARTHYRHELRSLIYVTLDGANGGIIRNLNCEGVAVQAVAPLRQQQVVRLRFECRPLRLRVETLGEVRWANSTGQCGIRFVELPARTAHQIDEWIFSSLLEAIARHGAHPASIFAASSLSMVRAEDRTEVQPDVQEVQEGNVVEENDGLTLSAPPHPVIRLEPGFARRGAAQALHPQREEDRSIGVSDPSTQLSWLSRPLSGRTLAWLVDGLVIIAALLLFALIFLSMAHELPQWPLTLGAASAAAVFVAAAYWALFAMVGGASLGARMAQAISGYEEKKESDAPH